jgi:hypothetical protein
MLLFPLLLTHYLCQKIELMIHQTMCSYIVKYKLISLYKDEFYQQLVTLNQVNFYSLFHFTEMNSILLKNKHLNIHTVIKCICEKYLAGGHFNF